MPKNSAVINPRRSRRQQGIEITPIEVKQTRRKKSNTTIAAEKVVEIEDEDKIEEEQTQETEEADEQGGQEHEGHEEEGREEEGEEHGGQEKEDREKEGQEEEGREKEGQDKEGHEKEDQEKEGQEKEDCEPQQPNAKKRKTRGPTRMSKVAKNPEEKVDVEFTSLGEHVGKGSVTLSSFLGPLVREHVPVILKDWRYLNEQTKAAMWEEIQGRFNLSEPWQKDCIFKQMGCIWRASKSRFVSKVRSTRSWQQILDLKPSNIQSVTAWTKWVKSKTSTDFKEISEKYKELRKNQIPQTTSRKGMVRLAHEMKEKSSDPSKVTRSKVWLAGHTHSDGRPVRPEFKEIIDKISTLDSEMDSTSDVRDDAVSKVLGKDKSGRVKGLGRGVTATKLAFIQARDSHVLKLEATQAQLLSKVEDLQNVVRDLAADKMRHLDDGYKSEFSGDGIKGPRCQLLEWFSEDDVVVGEGEFCSAEPTYKIGRIPLGPNAAAVMVKSASIKDAALWRPTTTLTSLGQAVGLKISWPFDKIILDRMDSTDGTKTAGSSAADASDNKVLIFDWNMTDELIAEGTLLSTDPQHLVNNISMGPNAAAVKVHKVVNEKAYLWRPSADMRFMSDALNENIVWPINNIQLLSPQARQDSASKKSSKSSGSTSTNTSNGKNNKCILLAISGTGEKIAEGRLHSSNPEAKVHHVPLGPNASEVWVDIVKVGDAPVWRPSAEVEIIADALGTRVAWPNDKLVFS